MSDSEDDEIIKLQADTLKALQEFYEEREKQEKLIKQLGERGLIESNVFDENWQLSQFWYDDKTIKTIVKALQQISTDETNICLISCPTLYGPIKSEIKHKCKVKLLEFDKRFAVHKDDFVFYDYSNPCDIPTDMIKAFDIVIADPPFLSEECLTKMTETIKLLSKDKIILCTGAIMKPLAESLLTLSVCEFKPEHKNNLGNDFSCYTNFDLDTLIK